MIGVHEIRSSASRPAAVANCVVLALVAGAVVLTTFASSGGIALADELAAVDDAYSARADQSLVVGAIEDLLANDTLPTSTGSGVVSATTPGKGTVDVSSDGGFVYAPFNYPTVAFLGEDSLEYTVCRDVPVPADFDGDGTTDRAVYRPAYGGGYVEGASTTFYGFGSDIPLLLPQAVYLAFFAD